MKGGRDIVSDIPDLLVCRSSSFFSLSRFIGLCVCLVFICDQSKSSLIIPFIEIHMNFAGIFYIFLHFCRFIRFYYFWSSSTISHSLLSSTILQIFGDFSVISQFHPIPDNLFPFFSHFFALPDAMRTFTRLQALFPYTNTMNRNKSDLISSTIAAKINDFSSHSISSAYYVIKISNMYRKSCVSRANRIFQDYSPGIWTKKKWYECDIKSIWWFWWVSSPTTYKNPIWSWSVPVSSRYTHICVQVHNHKSPICWIYSM